MEKQTPEEVIELLMSVLFFPDHFGMDPEESSLEDHDLYVAAIQEYFPTANIDYGVSKFVITFSDLPFVVKIPFNGTYTYDSEFYYFEHADPSCPDDYCHSEWIKYQAAAKRGFDKFLAKIDFYDYDYAGHAYYYQEKVIPTGKYHGKYASEASYNSVNNFSAEQMICDADWLARAIEYYGEQLTLDFINYVNNLDPEIGQDLHRGNYGYRPNGEPVILDYSGWND